MRHRQVLAVTAIALFGLAGCADRPNDLDTYYDDPVPTSKPVPPVEPSPQPSSPAPSTPSAPVPDARAALLTEADLAEEGVRPTGGEVSGCLTGLTGDSGSAGRWAYPSGSSLDHQVSVYPDRPGAEVVAAADCAGKRLTLPPQDGVDAQRAWCEGAKCTVLLAKGNVVSALSVSASSEARATDAAKRLLPVIVAKLSALKAS
ncbi:hypothetical protein [Amycolatopsis sp. H20-H5]|uniref:hypothetical protein n=1 Tax=Amycolatopsis sp. H20-H5 TaxID=3046309 RepID=UPI002DBE3502|nr:hypothetical protein [Amycolatopsis sp. H20-H5]MEC3979382.1 hypothetical protein [Amycolatopsis sp. H20-H5]